MTRPGFVGCGAVAEEEPFRAFQGSPGKASYRHEWRCFVNAIETDSCVECSLEDGRAPRETRFWPRSGRP